jgi:YHS domain-containing protein
VEAKRIGAIILDATLICNPFPLHDLWAGIYRLRRKPRVVHFKKSFLVLGLILAVSLFILSGVSLAKDQTTCPVMGGLINKNIYADYQGSRIYFCCPPCLKEFKKDPEKYVKKMKEQGIALAKSPDSGT